MSRQPSSIALNGTVLDMHSAWMAFLQQVSVEDRKAVVAILSCARTDSLVGINELLMKLTCAVLVGDVSPVVSEAVRPLIELMTANVHAMNVAKGAQNATSGDMAAIMADLARRLNGVSQVKATYTTIEAATDKQALPDHNVVDHEPVPPIPVELPLRADS